MRVGDLCWVVNIVGKGHLRAAYPTREAAVHDARAMGLDDYVVRQARVYGVTTLGGRRVADDVQLEA